MALDSGHELAPNDPWSPEFQQDPFPFYQWLRRQGPVYFDPDREIYFVSQYAEVQEVLKKPQIFSSEVDRREMRPGGIFPALREIKERDWPVHKTITRNDDKPTHGMYRNLVSDFFTAPALRSLEPFVAGKVDELLSGLESRGGGDFVAGFAVPLPISVIAFRLGLTDFSYETLKRWSDAFADEIGLLSSEERAIEAAELVLEAHIAMVETARARRENPRDDILSHLAAARGADGQALTDTEIVSVTTTLLVAGNETTTNMLGHATRRFAEHPGLLERLRTEPALIPGFIEEILRLESPVQGQFRRALCDTVLAGVPIPEGALLHIRLASANRDEAVYGSESGTLKLGERQPRPHLSFGMGMHFCLGAMLSKLEMRIAFQAMADRWRSVSLDPDAAPPRYGAHFSHRGLTALPIRIERR